MVRQLIKDDIKKFSKNNKLTFIFTKDNLIKEFEKLKKEISTFVKFCNENCTEEDKKLLIIYAANYIKINFDEKLVNFIKKNYFNENKEFLRNFLFETLYFIDILKLSIKDEGALKLKCARLSNSTK